MKIAYRTRALVLAGITAALIGCSDPVRESDRTGYISDYSNLEQVDDKTYLYFSDRIVAYQQFLIEPVEILLERDPDNQVFTDEQLDDLKTYTAVQLAKALSKGDDGFEIVDEPGPGVGRIRIGITQLDKTDGAMNLSTYTKITGAGLGGVALEGEIVDAVTGEQLSATVRWGSGSRVGRAGFTSTGDAKILIARWSGRVREKLDEMRDQAD